MKKICGFALLLIGAALVLVIAPFWFIGQTARELWRADIVPAWHRRWR